MLVVGAMLVWVLAAFLRLGYRWGQLGLFALLLVSAYVSIALGFVLAPPPVFVVVAVVSLLVEGVAVVCLWHPDTRAFLAGPWARLVGGLGGESADAGRPQPTVRRPLRPDLSPQASRRPLVRCRWAGVPFRCSNICSITPAPGRATSTPAPHRAGSTGVDRATVDEAKGAGMRRYDDPVETRMGLVSGMEGPEQFLWRGRLWKVRAVIAHWVETGPWWQSGGARAVIGSDEPAAPASVGRARRAPTSSPSASCGGSRPAVARADPPLSTGTELDGPLAVDGGGVFDLAFDWSDGRWALVGCAD